MDSIVDSFFPFLEVIEKEVLEIEHLVFSVGDGTGIPTSEKVAATQSGSSGSERVGDTSPRREERLDEGR